MKLRALFATAALLLSTVSAAASIDVTISNTTTWNWSTGLIALAPLIDLGPSPDAGPKFATYTFLHPTCQLDDSYCDGGCNDTGDAALLAKRWGYTIGTNAWVVPALAAGTSATVTISATNPQKMYFAAFVLATADDAIYAYAPGNPQDLAVPLFDGSGNPLAFVSMGIGGYDPNSVSSTDGSAASCTNVCPATPSAAQIGMGFTACYNSLGNGNTGSFEPTPDHRLLTATSGTTQNTLFWSNSNPHEGTLIIRRAGSPPTTAPTNGATYTAGSAIGTGTVAYVDGPTGSTATSFTDTGLTNNTRYYYRLYNYYNNRTYSAGNVPSSSGLFSEPTPKTGNFPRWCYSTGFSSTQQPLTVSGVSIYSSNSNGMIFGLNTVTGAPASDGLERIRPFSVDGGIQARFPMAKFEGRSGYFGAVGDQAGYGYLFDTSSGAIAWVAGGGTKMGSAIQAQPALQLYAYANSAFQSANAPGGVTRDLVIFGTKNGSTTTNKVYAFSSRDGSLVWRYAPGDLGDINGGIAVDCVNNRAWVASANTSGNTVRVLSTINPVSGVPTFVTGFANGATDKSVILDTIGGTAYTVSNAGTVRSYSISGTPAQISSIAVGATPNSYVYPLNKGFLLSYSNNVRRYESDGGIKWTASVPNTPTGVIVDFNSSPQRVFASNTRGLIYEINIDDGGVTKAVQMIDAGVNLGMPTLDKAVNRLHVGTADGRVCAFSEPLQ